MTRYDPARDCFTQDPPPSATLPPFESSPSEQLPSTPHVPTHAPEPNSLNGASSSPTDSSAKKPAKSGSPTSPTRKRKASPPLAAEDGKPIPLNAANLPKIKRRKASDGDAPPRHIRQDRGSRNRYRYDSPPPLIPKEREPTPPPPPSRNTSPPRQRKRPGAASRLSEREKQEAQEKLRRREEEERQATLQAAKARGVEEVVRSHYNEKRELGKTWRKTDSRIKGLRSFNNWVKSTLVQKFSPADDFDPRNPSYNRDDALIVLDIGCGKGGDLLKWKQAPQEVQLYVGIDTADVSIAHARDRYDSMLRDARRQRNGRPPFDAQFHAMDCWTHWIGEIPIVNEVGADPNIGPGADRMAARWGSRSRFDVVSMMFCMHYAFESETKCRTMLRNVAGALRSGGRFIGTVPSSDAISKRVTGQDPRDKLPENPEKGVREWGNSIYRVKFAEEPPRSGTFRPPFGWKYNYFLEEAVEEVPEYVVPWEAFRALAEDYNLDLVYKKPFHDVWKEEKDDPELKILSERMGVKNRDGSFALGDDEWEAVGFYTAFCFKKL